MRVLVCGSRTFNDYEKMKEVLDEIEITEIIEGEARGADKLSRDWALENNVPARRFPADWKLHGKRAGPIRNSQMLKEGKPEMVVAFRGPNSRGTQNMIDQATKAGIPVRMIEIEN
jgi:hypothetical protein